jgi:hypothetical protein
MIERFDPGKIGTSARLLLDKAVSWKCPVDRSTSAQSVWAAVPVKRRTGS